MHLKPEVSSTDHIQGSDSAAVTLVEYGDYQCPHCGLAHPVVKKLQKQFGPSLRFVFRNFPLTQMHPLAETAAETAEFAATHDRFWQMHDAIFEHQSKLAPNYLLTLAERIGLAPNLLATALNEGAFRDRVKTDFLSGVKSGVNGTPTFFINGQRHDGAPDFESLSEAISSEL